MKYVSRITTIGYAIVTALLLWLSALWQHAMRTARTERPFFAAMFGCFVIACVLIGGTLYAYRTCVRRHREFLMDFWMLFVVGLVLMGLTLVSFFSYGGIDRILTEKGVRAQNFMMVILSALPLPFLLGTVVSALGRGERSVPWRVILGCVAAAVTVAYIGRIVSGELFALLTYSAEETLWI